MDDQFLVAIISVSFLFGGIFGYVIGSAERDSKRRHPGEDTEHGRVEP